MSHLASAAFFLGLDVLAAFILPFPVGALVGGDFAMGSRRVVAEADGEGARKVAPFGRSQPRARNHEVQNNQNTVFMSL